MQRFSPPVLITTSMFSIIARGSEYSAAQRLSPWRKGTRRRESRRRATSPEKAREREREQLQRAHSHRARRAQRAHKATQRRVAPWVGVRRRPLNMRAPRGTWGWLAIASPRKKKGRARLGCPPPLPAHTPTALPLPPFVRRRLFSFRTLPCPLLIPLVPTSPPLPPPPPPLVLGTSPGSWPLSKTVSAN